MFDSDALPPEGVPALQVLASALPAHLHLSDPRASGCLVRRPRAGRAHYLPGGWAARPSRRQPPGSGWCSRPPAYSSAPAYRGTGWHTVHVAEVAGCLAECSATAAPATTPPIARRNSSGPVARLPVNSVR